MGERTPNHQEEKSVLFLLGGFREGQPSTGWRMRGEGREKEQREEKITTKQEKSVEKKINDKTQRKTINRDEMHHRKKLYFWVELHLKI